MLKQYFSKPVNVDRIRDCYNRVHLERAVLCTQGSRTI